MKNEDKKEDKEFEYEKKRINFTLTLKLNKLNKYELEYKGVTPYDQMLIDINKYGSGAHEVEPKTGGILNQIRVTNNFIGRDVFGSDWNRDDK